MYTLYYRNYIKSCNYNCVYCPFQKIKISKAKIKKDKKYLNKFVEYIKNSCESFNIFLAPKGEILNFDYYQEAISELSHVSNIGEVVVQSNLSGDLEWLENVNRDKLILWTTYHPTEVDISDYLSQINSLIEYNIRFTVGIVGVKGNFTKIEEMNNSLDRFGENRPYLWINAYKDRRNYYTGKDVEFLNKIDRLFELNLKDYKSKNLKCKTGEIVFFVEWNGSIHRCWQDKKKLGNLYNTSLDIVSSSVTCTKDICSCYIGYSNIEDLRLDKIYKESLLGRIP